MDWLDVYRLGFWAGMIPATVFAICHAINRVYASVHLYITSPSGMWYRQNDTMFKGGFYGKWMRGNEHINPILDLMSVFVMWCIHILYSLIWPLAVIPFSVMAGAKYARYHYQRKEELVRTLRNQSTQQRTRKKQK